MMCTSARDVRKCERNSRRIQYRSCRQEGHRAELLPEATRYRCRFFCRPRCPSAEPHSSYSLFRRCLTRILLEGFLGSNSWRSSRSRFSETELAFCLAKSSSCPPHWPIRLLPNGKCERTAAKQDCRGARQELQHQMQSPASPFTTPRDTEP